MKYILITTVFSICKMFVAIAIWLIIFKIAEYICDKIIMIRTRRKYGKRIENCEKVASSQPQAYMLYEYDRFRTKVIEMDLCNAPTIDESTTRFRWTNDSFDYMTRSSVDEPWKCTSVTWKDYTMQTGNKT